MGKSKFNNAYPFSFLLRARNVHNGGLLVARDCASKIEPIISLVIHERVLLGSVWLGRRAYVSLFSQDNDCDILTPFGKLRSSSSAFDTWR